MRTWTRKAGAALVGLAACLSSATAQQFPAANVKIVVPFPPGGTTDILARQLGAELTKEWGHAVIVENRAGASGTIYSEQFARTAPDGYTLMLTATHHVINPSLYKTLKYDSRTDFTPIALVAEVPNVLVAHPSFPANDVKGLVSYAKQNPGKVNFGSAGVGGANHLSGELFKTLAGVEIVHIPYKGAAPALNDLLGGQIPIMFDSVPGVLQHIKAGKLRALGVTSLKRSKALPDIPTIDEAGVKGFEATAWFGLYAPGRMPPEIVKALSSSVQKALASPRIRSQFEEQGAEAGTLSQPEFVQFVNAEMDKWGKVIEAAKIKID